MFIARVMGVMQDSHPFLGPPGGTRSIADPASSCGLRRTSLRFTINDCRSRNGESQAIADLGMRIAECQYGKHLAFGTRQSRWTCLPVGRSGRGRRKGRNPRGLRTEESRPWQWPGVGGTHSILMDRDEDAVNAPNTPNAQTLRRRRTLQAPGQTRCAVRAWRGAAPRDPGRAERAGPATQRPWAPRRWRFRIDNCRSTSGSPAGVPGGGAFVRPATSGFHHPREICIIPGPSSYCHADRGGGTGALSMHTIVSSEILSRDARGARASGAADTENSR